MSESLSAAAERVAESFAAAVASRRTFEAPYRHCLLENVFPADVAEELAHLPFAPPVLNGVSGKRELHNDQRSYFDVGGVTRFPVMRGVAEALQSTRIAGLIHDAFDAPIDDSFLRLEYAQDVDGFWLQPHTDLGVKKFTCLIYLSEGPGHETLGTDIYETPERHFGVSPFRRGAAMVFVPGENTWHGFEKRRIKGVRRSVILNYVTHEWRAREQLSYPDKPVRV
ncbi:MAG: 2OG-Fe(II) oxygenase [Roseiarcus sp.]